MNRARLTIGTLLLACSLLSGNRAKGETQAVCLAAGWNLISFQVEPSNPNVNAVLGAIVGDVTEVWAYDSSSLPPLWIGYVSNGSVQTLSEMHGGAAYWIHMTDSLIGELTLEVEGTPIAGVPVCNGWNLVGSYSRFSLAVEDALGQLPSNSEVWGYDELTQAWSQFTPVSPSFLTDLADVGPGTGYWIHLNLNQCMTWGGPIINVVASSDLRFGAGPEHYTVRISNLGTGTLNWSLSSDVPWLTMIPTSGTTTAETDVVSVGIDWSAITFPSVQSQELLGTLTVLSNGGAVALPLTAVVQPVSGHYGGFAVPTVVNGKNVPLSNIKLAMDIATDGHSAVMTSERTPFFPADITQGTGPSCATITTILTDVTFNGFGTGKELILGSSFAIPVGDPSNLFDRPLVRTLTLRGEWISNSVVSGENIGDYTETVEVPGTAPIVIQGTFRLTKASPLDAPPTGTDSARTFRPDLDGDGMPTDWEIRYGLNYDDPLGPNGATGNPDGDGRTNIEEYWNRTDPRTCDSVPATSRIFGSVSDVSGAVPMANVAVTLNSAALVLVQKTDPSGGYSFDNLVPGYYTIGFGSYPGFSFQPALNGVFVGRKATQLNSVGTRHATSTQVDFVGWPLEGEAPLTVQFVTLQSTPDTTTWVWFVNGVGTAFTRDFVHTFTQPGEYSIRLLSDFPILQKNAYVRVGSPRSAVTKLQGSVHSIMGGHAAQLDFMVAGQTKLDAVAGTSVGSDATVSSSSDTRLVLDDVP